MTKREELEWYIENGGRTERYFLLEAIKEIKALEAEIRQLKAEYDDGS